jgi:hypothetical protein
VVTTGLTRTTSSSIRDGSARSARERTTVDSRPWTGSDDANPVGPDDDTRVPPPIAEAPVEPVGQPGGGHRGEPVLERNLSARLQSRPREHTPDGAGLERGRERLVHERLGSQLATGGRRDPPTGRDEPDRPHELARDGGLDLRTRLGTRQATHGDAADRRPSWDRPSLGQRDHPGRSGEERDQRSQDGERDEHPASAPTRAAHGGDERPRHRTADGSGRPSGPRRRPAAYPTCLTNNTRSSPGPS